MFFGVSKSGSPISRWTTSTPFASSCRARARTSNAVSVPRRLIADASLIAIGWRSLRYGNLARPADRAVLEAGRGHGLRVVEVAAVDEDRAAHRPAQARQVELLELVPLGDQDEGVGVPGGRVGVGAELDRGQQARGVGAGGGVAGAQ